MKAIILAVLMGSTFVTFQASATCYSKVKDTFYGANQLGSSEGIIHYYLKAGNPNTVEIASIVDKNKGLSDKLATTVTNVINSCVVDKCQNEFRDLVMQSRLYGYKEGRIIVTKKTESAEVLSSLEENYAQTFVDIDQRIKDFNKKCM